MAPSFLFMIPFLCKNIAYFFTCDIRYLKFLRFSLLITVVNLIYTCLFRITHFLIVIISIPKISVWVFLLTASIRRSFTPYFQRKPKKRFGTTCSTKVRLSRLAIFTLDESPAEHPTKSSHLSWYSIQRSVSTM